MEVNVEVYARNAEMSECELHACQLQLLLVRGNAQHRGTWLGAAQCLHLVLGSLPGLRNAPDPPNVELLRVLAMEQNLFALIQSYNSNHQIVLIW